MKAEWTNNDSLTTSQTTKAILVIDMPKCCDNCPCTDYMFCYATQKELEIDWEVNKPSWCPLRPLPLKRRIPFTKTFGTPFNKGKAKGWNECIDKILGETE